MSGETHFHSCSGGPIQMKKYKFAFASLMLLALTLSVSISPLTRMVTAHDGDITKLTYPESKKVCRTRKVATWRFFAFADWKVCCLWNLGRRFRLEGFLRSRCRDEKGAARTPSVDQIFRGFVARRRRLLLQPLSDA